MNDIDNLFGTLAALIINDESDVRLKQVATAALAISVIVVKDIRRTADALEQIAASCAALADCTMVTVHRG